MAVNIKMKDTDKEDDNDSEDNMVELEEYENENKDNKNEDLTDVSVSDNSVEDNSSTDEDDDAPVSFSLQESKQIAQDSREKERQSVIALKEQKKNAAFERDNKNKLQQDDKRLRKPSLVPPKLNEKVLNMVDKEIDMKSVAEKLIVKNAQAQEEKTYFSEDSDDDDIEGENCFLSENEEGNDIKACYIDNITKVGHGSTATDFLNEHFFGERLKREKYSNIAIVRKRKGVVNQSQKKKKKK